MMWIVALMVYALALARPLKEQTLVVVDANGASVDADSVVAPLEARGHTVTVKAVRDGVELFDLGVKAWDNLVIIPGKTKGLGKTLTTKNLLQFLRDGGNIVALTTPSASPVSLRDTALQLGISVGSRGVTLVDHFGGELDAGNFEVPAIVDYVEGTTVSNCSVATIDGSNPLAFGILSAPFTSFSENLLEGGDKFTSGSEGYVAAGLQTRSNARFVWVGSPELLAGPVGSALTEWAFQEKGVLRIKSVSHHDDLNNQHHVYKVSQDITYCAAIEQWNGQEWTHYDSSDVQLEFRMLDPYYRLTLDSAGCTTFTIPDQYGMFTFDVDYTRPGLTYLKDEKTVTIRHTANDEWPRSWTITNSWVYLSSAFAVIAGWLLFVGVYFSV